MPINQAPFPATRFRRTRADAARRSMVRETGLCTSDLIWPLFVMEGEGDRHAVPSMPGVERFFFDVAATAEI